MVRKICSLFAYLTLSLSALPVLAQKSDEEARVTLTINPDGSETVYQKDAASHQAIAMTTGADGKPLRKIIYRLDNGGRYESGQVFGANGAFRFKTLYKYDATGRLAQETQRSKDDSIRRRIVYNYDASGNPAGTQFTMATANCWDGQFQKNRPPKGHAPTADRVRSSLHSLGRAASPLASMGKESYQVNA